MKKSPKVKIVEVTMTRRIPLEEKICPQCGKRFEGAKLARFCSKACANKASYQRHAETTREKRMAKYYQEKRAAAGKK
jgi:hypothetical protein